MTGSKQRFGRWGEGLAASYLASRGYTILDQNVRTPYGEIDLVACQKVPLRSGPAADGEDSERVVVFVEVKTRSSTAYGLPEEAVTARKQERLLASAEAYLMEHPELGPDWRVDVIAIQTFRGRRSPEIVHFQNVLH